MGKILVPGGPLPRKLILAAMPFVYEGRDSLHAEEHIGIVLTNDAHEPVDLTGFKATVRAFRLDPREFKLECACDVEPEGKKGLVQFHRKLYAGKYEIWWQLSHDDYANQFHDIHQTIEIREGASHRFCCDCGAPFKTGDGVFGRVFRRWGDVDRASAVQCRACLDEDLSGDAMTHFLCMGSFPDEWTQVWREHVEEELGKYAALKGSAYGYR